MNLSGARERTGQVIAEGVPVTDESSLSNDKAAFHGVDLAQPELGPYCELYHGVRSSSVWQWALLDREAATDVDEDQRAPDYPPW